MKLLTLILLLGASVLSAQIRWEAVKPVPADDIALPALRSWQEKITEGYRKNGSAGAQFSTWAELPFPSLKKLFPELRFFAVSWSELPTPGVNKPFSLALGMEYTLVCDANGKIVKEISHYGNYEPYGELLAAEKVSIRSSDDAKLVWEGFTDLHQKHWKDNPAVKVSDTIWHLGDKTIRDVRYYYEVVLDAAQTIVSAKLHADHLPLAQPK